MLNNHELQAIAKSPGPMISVYVNTARKDASTHPLVPDHRTWFKKEAHALAHTLLPGEARRFALQVKRVDRFLDNRRPEEKALVIFAGLKTWVAVPLQVSVNDQVHWGKPAVGQLFRLVEEHKPYVVAIVDHRGARFFKRFVGELSDLGEKAFEIDKSQWKKKDLGHVTSELTRKTRGPNRDLYEHRLEAQYERLCHETANELATLSRGHGAVWIFLVGSERLTSPIRRKIPQALQQRVVAVPEDLGKFSATEVLRRVGPLAEERESERQSAVVKELLAGAGKSIVSPIETLKRLQKGTLRTIVVAAHSDVALFECPKCHSVDLLGDAVCTECGGPTLRVPLLEALPRLVAAYDAEVEFVSGDAERILARTGGIAGWSRPPKVMAAAG